MREWEKRDIVDILTEQHVKIVQASVELSEGMSVAFSVWQKSAELDHDALVIEHYLETNHGLAWDGQEFSTAPVSDEMRAVSIKRWIRDGHDGLAAQDIDTTALLLEAAGRRLDKACSHDIMGEILFEAEDGKTYAGCVEFMITEANPEYVKDVLVEEGLDVLKDKANEIVRVITETMRREMVEEENTRQDDDIEGQSWTTEQLQEDFTVSQFLAPLVLVRRKSDGVKGTLMFRHHPRLYYGFEVEIKR